MDPPFGLLEEVVLISRGVQVVICIYLFELLKNEASTEKDSTCTQVSQLITRMQY